MKPPITYWTIAYEAALAVLCTAIGYWAPCMIFMWVGGLACGMALTHLAVYGLLRRVK